MDDKLKDSLIALVNQITDWSNKAIQFGSDIVPELIRQYLTSAYVKCWINIGAWAIALISLYMAVSAIVRYVNRSSDLSCDGRIIIRVLTTIVCIIVSLIAIPSVYFDVTDMIDIKLAPYVYTLQHAKDMVGLK